MGICSSCEAVPQPATAKLIHQDGRLQEFPYPVKVSYVLQQADPNYSFFICNSDEMDFGDVVSPVGDDDELLPGQLYFALPINRLRSPLPPEEMAALAVKASAALMKYGDKFGCRKSRPPVFYDGGEKDASVTESVVVGGRKAGRNSGKRSEGGSGGGGRRRKLFTANLSTIEE